MKTHLFKTTILACALLLSSCLCNKSVDYKEDGRWQISYFNEDYQHNYPYLHHPNPFTQWNRLFIPIDVQSRNLSKDYNISLESATTIIALIHSPHLDKDLEALSLDKNDLAPITQLKMPSNESIQRVADVLGENPQTIHSMFQDFIVSLQSR